MRGDDTSSPPPAQDRLPRSTLDVPAQPQPDIAPSSNASPSVLREKKGHIVAWGVPAVGRAQGHHTTRPRASRAPPTRDTCKRARNAICAW
eukprot:scaffold293771_cov39-Tisochrysis_lutea.AAC.4